LSGFRMIIAIQQPEPNLSGFRMFPVFRCPVFGSPVCFDPIAKYLFSKISHYFLPFSEMFQ
jgi:hypothetical protein